MKITNELKDSTKVYLDSYDIETTSIDRSKALRANTSIIESILVAQGFEGNAGLRCEDGRVILLSMKKNKLLPIQVLGSLSKMTKV